MTKVKIVTDSSVTIEPEVVKELDITVVPLSVMIDSVLYSDADLGEGEFLRLMQASKNLPKTSQPPVGLFAEIFDDLGKDGSQVLAIHMSHALSGTVEAARQGASLSTTDVTVLDSSFTDQAMKFQVVEAARLAQEGKDLETILAYVEDVKKHTELYIGVSTLEAYEPENLLTKWMIARSYQETEELDAAYVLYKELATELKENPEFLEQYIYLLRELGKLEEAKEYIQAYLDLVPDDIQMQELYNHLI